MRKTVLVAALALLSLGGPVYGKTYNTPSVNSGHYSSWVDPRSSWNRPQVAPTNIRKHRTHRVYATRHRASVAVVAKGSNELVTVPTAAHVSITVNKKVVNQFQGFIADLVKTGYTPPRINCWARYGTHVWNSNHYHGGACDFNQRGWNLTDPPMYHVGALAKKWGLRDGCTFRRPDCGHIDDGANMGWKHPNIFTKFIDWATKPVRDILDPNANIEE